MPILIPTYFSKTAPGVVDRGGTSPASTGGLVAQGLQSVSRVLADIQLDADKQVGDAARLGEFVSRKGRLTDRLGVLEESLAQDPDHRTYFDRAKKGIAEASTEFLAGVTDPTLKNALLEHVSTVQDRALVDARHKARSLTVDFTRGALEDSIGQNIRAAISATDAEGLTKAEGGIEASIRGAVSSGILSAPLGEKARRGAREKIYTTLAEQMADQEPDRFLSNHKEGLYKDTVDPLRLEGIRRHAVERQKALVTSDNLQEAGSAAEEIWNRMGPFGDLAPVNLDVMEGEVAKLFAGNQERAKLARAVLREKTAAHDKGVAERKNANLSAIWKASLAGQGIARIVASPEYAALDGNTQRLAKEHLEDRSWTLKGRAEADPEKRATQYEIYWRVSQPKVLGSMTEKAVTALYPSLGVDLTDRLIQSKRGLDKPGKLAEAKIDADDFNHFARLYGLSPENKDDKATLGEIRYQVENAIEAEQQSRGKNLTREEKGKIMKRGLVEVTVRVKEPSFFSTGLQKMRVFDVQDPGAISVPPAHRDRIVEHLKSRGLPVTGDNIRELYIRLMEK